MRAACFLLLAAFLISFFPQPVAAGWFLRENQLAWRAWKSGDYSRSLLYWDKSGRGLFGRGTVLLHLHRWRRAERNLRQALNLAPMDRPKEVASIWYNLGNSLYAQGKLDEARMAWRQALQYNPDHSKARHNLALLESLLGRSGWPRLGQPGGGGKGDVARESQKETRKPAEHRNTQLPLPFQTHSGQGGAAGQGGEQRGDTGRKDTTRQGEGMQRRHTMGHRERGAGRQRLHAAAAARRAIGELGMVKEGVGLFLRRRLAAPGSRSLFMSGGPSW